MSPTNASNTIGKSSAKRPLPSNIAPNKMCLSSNNGNNFLAYLAFYGSDF